MPVENQEPEESPQTPPSAPERWKERSGDGTHGWYALMGIGFEFLATICVMGLLGWWLDGRFHTLPWLTIIGGAVGFAAGLMMIIRAGSRAFKD